MQMESNEIFDFWYDSIWSQQKGEQEKSWTVILKNEEFTKRRHKKDSQIFLPSWWTIPL
jgi:hypothetical protein